jgi:hypothetical protein
MTGGTTHHLLRQGAEHPMSVLINAYCTHRDPPPLAFPHELHGRRDRTDRNLSEHLNGFMGFVMRGGEREMTQSRYHVLRHIQRVQHHLSLDVADDDMDAFGEWAAAANAICFLPDETIRDPSGRILVDPESGDPEEGAEVPYPPDAIQRRARSNERLAELEVHVMPTLPPVISEVEIELRPAREVALRSFALFVVAVRAESLATNQELTVDELRQKRPRGFDALSPKETSFLDNPSPEQQAVIDHAWRYEALFLLQWALRWFDDLFLPTKICDVPRVARVMLQEDDDAMVRDAELRATSELLDALDLHYRLHWAVRQARLDETDPPANLESGVIAERHYALNWLTGFEDAEWDDVDTPT